MSSQHVMKACTCVERMANSFLTSKPGGGDLQHHVPAALPPGRKSIFRID